MRIKERLLIVKQILLVSTLGNVWRKVWRTCRLMFGCKGLMTNALKNYKVKSWKGEDIIFIFFICYPVAYFYSLIV